MPKFSPVHYKDLVKVFEADGFRCARIEGNHMVFTKPGVIKPVMSRERYFELLAR